MAELSESVTGLVEQFAKLPGIGKKTAERLVVELREKMVPYTRSDSKSSQLPENGNVKDAVEALLALGIKQHLADVYRTFLALHLS